MFKMFKLRLMLPVLIATALLVSLMGGPAVVQAQQGILFQDDFSTPGLWATILDDNFQIGYVNGVYQIQNNFFNSYVSSVRAAAASDLRIEVDANRVGGPVTGFYGAVCRWQDIHNYYALVISDDNTTGIVRIQDGAATFLAQGTAQFDPASWNRVGGDCAGNTLTLLINGQQVLEARDGTFAVGAVGMMVGTRGAPGVTVQFDNIVVSQADAALFPPPVGIIPPTGPQDQLYIIQPTDTLSELAVRFGTTVADLMARNPQITNPNLIFAGQRLAVPVQPVIPPTGPPATPEPPVIPETGAPFLPSPERQVFFDDFSQAGVWFTDITPNFQVEYINGTYRIFNLFPNLFVSSVRTFDLPDVHAEVDALWVSGPESGYWGAVCRWQDVNNYYAAVIGGDGTSGIVRIAGGIPSFIAQGSVELNTNAWNRIGVNCFDSTLTLFVNGEAVLQTADTTFSDGYIGVMVGTRGAPGVDVRFDNFTAYVP
jgi:LysM repeat protein